MVGLDWLDLDFFFHHFFQGSVPKFWGRSQNLSSADQGCAWAPAPAPGPAPWGPMGPHWAPWGPMGERKALNAARLSPGEGGGLPDGPSKGVHLASGGLAGLIGGVFKQFGTDGGSPGIPGDPWPMDPENQPLNSYQFIVYLISVPTLDLGSI